MTKSFGKGPSLALLCASAAVLLAASLNATSKELPTCYGITATIYVVNGRIVGGPNDGKPYHGRLIGTMGDDVIVGTGGNDVIQGRGGNDLICAGPGDDDISGGPGEDKIETGPGDDVIRAD